MFQNYWSESARHNWGGTPIEQQKDIDSMIVKQRTILDPAERLKYIQDMQVKFTESFLTVPYHASQMFGKNILALVTHLTHEGSLHLDRNDEITSAMTVVRDGQVVVPHPK